MAAARSTTLAVLRSRVVPWRVSSKMGPPAQQQRGRWPTGGCATPRGRRSRRRGGTGRSWPWPSLGQFGVCSHQRPMYTALPCFRGQQRQVRFVAGHDLQQRAVDGGHLRDESPVGWARIHGSCADCAACIVHLACERLQVQVGAEDAFDRCRPVRCAARRAVWAWRCVAWKRTAWRACFVSRPCVRICRSGGRGSATSVVAGNLACVVLAVAGRTASVSSGRCAVRSQASEPSHRKRQSSSFVEEEHRASIISNVAVPSVFVISG